MKLCLILALGSAAGAQAQTTPAAGGPSPPPSAVVRPAVARIAARPAGVAVVSAPGQRTASERRIEARTIAAQPLRSGDDLLRLVPGLLVARHGAEGKGNQIFLRGFDAVHGADVAVSMGGIPLNEASNIHGHGYLDLGLMIPEVVREIHVRKGPFQIDQGNFATAGSIDFDLGVADGLRGSRARYEIGSTGRHRLLALWAPPHLSEETFVAVEGMTDAGYGQNRAAQRLSLLAQARLLGGHGGPHLTALVSAYGARFGEPAPVPLSDFVSGRRDFYDTPSTDTQGSSQRILAGLRLRLDRRGDRLDALLYAQHRRLRLNEDFTGFLLYPERGDQRQQVQQTTAAGLRLRYERTLVRGLTLLTGADVSAEHIDQYEDQIDLAGAAWQRNRDLSAWQPTFSLHAALALHRLRWLRLQGGVRADVLAFFTEDRLSGGRGELASAAVSPRLSAAVLLPRGVSLFGAYGRGLRGPEARGVLAGDLIKTRELSEFGGRPPALTTSDSGEVGLRWRGRWVQAAAAAFGTWLDNEVLFDHVAAVNVALNATRRLGVEVEARVTPRPWLDLVADATYVDARFVDSGEPVPMAPRFLMTVLGTLWHPSGVHAGLRLLYLAPRPLRYGATAGGAAILDLSVGYRYRALEVGVQLDNTLNSQWREGEFHYASWFDSSAPRSELPTIHYAAGPPLVFRGGLTLFL